MLQTMQ
jgi:hypothetical protein